MLCVRRAEDQCSDGIVSKTAEWINLSQRPDTPPPQCSEDVVKWHVLSVRFVNERFKSLIAHGADSDAKNEEEQTPIHLAAAAGRTK